MPLSPTYTLLEEISQDNRIRSFRGFIAANHVPVIIKMIQAEACDLADVSRIINEFKIAQALNMDGIIKPIELLQRESCFALIMEDAGAVPLREYTGNQAVDLGTFVNIAVQLADILGRIHDRGIIHGGLSPDNIFIHAGTGKAYLTGFGNASIISSESNSESLIPIGFDRPYEYISPEQTGRLSAGLDQRSDLYSLGVIFYEMLTGSLPIKAESEAEWLHAHITSKPLPPEKINPRIPLAVSGIIMKLLEKNPDERYQSAFGLMLDLEECRRQLNQKGRIEYFTIGSKDINYSFQLPQKLYGREWEKDLLESVFDRVCKGSREIVLVSGYAGTGKTVLINQFLKPLVLGRGYFISGKMDQLRKNIPYAAFLDAFRNLIMQLMTESEKQLSYWKKTILRVLKKNSSVMTELIPELEYIIGKQPPAEILSPKEAEYRFSMIFRDFMGIFADRKHPLVIFLDDLQWADNACIKLINSLIGDTNLSSLLLVLAYRQNEVSEAHPLARLVKRPAADRANITHIQLAPLDWMQTSRMVADTLRVEPENVASLSEILYRESGGNPFFLKQLLMLIHDNRLLYFDTSGGSWQWKIKEIQNLNLGNDVQHLFLKKLQNIPKETLEILKLASCIGNSFNLQTLAEALGMTAEAAVLNLIPAVHEGLVLPAANQKESSEYRFLHDKVQQAVYSMIEEKEKKEMHLVLGRLLLRKAKDGKSLNEDILSIMDHFNRSLDLVHDPDERLHLAGYNLLAGRKAKSTAAYDSALQYFRYGSALLPDRCWEADYKLSYDLYLELAQAEYLSGNEKLAEKLFDTVIQKAATELERAGIYSIKILLYASSGKYDEAVNTGILALGRLGMKIPAHPAKADYIKEMITYIWNMRNKKIEDLVNLPELTDPVQKKIAELLSRLSSVTMSTHPDLYSYIIMKTGNHATSHGNSYMTSVGYFGYSFTMGIILGNYKTGGRLANVCIELAEKYGHSASQCIIYFVIGSFIVHWNQHLSKALEYMEKAIQHGKEAGDVLIMGYANCMILETRYLLGTSLTEMEKEAEAKNETASLLKHGNLAINAAIYERIVSMLQGKGRKPLTESMAEFENQEFVDYVKGDNTSLATYYIHKIHLSYLAGDYCKALEAARRVEPLYHAILGFMINAEYTFYYSLVIIAIFNEFSWPEKRRYWRVLQKNLKQLKKWAHSCKENFMHKYLLVRAEISRLKNKNSDAMTLYNMAIDSAQENGFLQTEALANELAAKFYLSLDMEEIAKIYMRDALGAYRKWGAMAKVQQLNELYPQLAADTQLHAEKDNKVQLVDGMLRISPSDHSKSAEMLDTYYLEKAVRSISNETDISKYITSFLELAVEYVGADKGFLLMYKDTDLIIEAKKESSSEAAAICSIPLEEAAGLSKAVVRYVVRTQETVIVNCGNGDEKGIFDYDLYIARSKSKSIGCIPLVFQKSALGVLYFENSLVPGVFSAELLESLKLLVVQIAYVEKMQSHLDESAVVKTAEALPYHIDPLTEREMEVLKLIAEGMSNKEIADHLHITINTVKGYIKNIYQKLGVSRRVQVVTRARELNLLE